MPQTRKGSFLIISIVLYSVSSTYVATIRQHFFCSGVFLCVAWDVVFWALVFVLMGIELVALTVVVLCWRS